MLLGVAVLSVFFFTWQRDASDKFRDVTLFLLSSHPCGLWVDPVSQSHPREDDQKFPSVCFSKSNLTHCFGLANTVYFLATLALMKRDLVVRSVSCRKACITQGDSTGAA